MSHVKCHACGGSGYVVGCEDTESDTEPVKVVHDEEIGLIMQIEDPAITEARRRGWYLASRCTVHVCNSRDMFVDYQPWTNHEVILDNNSHVEVAGVGTVLLRFTTGKVLTLSNVFHMPAIVKCLVSPAELLRDGFDVSCGASGAKIKKKNKTVGKGYIEDGLIRLSANTMPPKVVHNEEIGFMTRVEDPALTEARRRGWYLASRCTVHVCNSRDMFVEYHPWVNHEVVLENNEHAEVAGVGTVVLRFTTGKILTLSNVFHVPAVVKCFVSVKQLLGLGFEISFPGGGAKLEKNRETVGRGYAEDGVIRLNVIEEHEQD